MSEIAPLDPERLIGALNKHEVQFVLIGALAARLYGFPRLTADADITPAQNTDNFKHLAAALERQSWLRQRFPVGRGDADFTSM